MKIVFFSVIVQSGKEENAIVDKTSSEKFIAGTIFSSFCPYSRSKLTTARVTAHREVEGAGDEDDEPVLSGVPGGEGSAPNDAIFGSEDSYRSARS